MDKRSVKVVGARRSRRLSFSDRPSVVMVRVPSIYLRCRTRRAGEGCYLQHARMLARLTVVPTQETAVDETNPFTPHLFGLNILGLGARVVAAVPKVIGPILVVDDAADVLWRKHDSVMDITLRVSVKAFLLSTQGPGVVVIVNLHEGAVKCRGGGRDQK